MSLFWRILGGYFLAWLLLCVALLSTLALDSRARFLPRAAVSQTKPAAIGVQIAAGTLSSGGEESFRALAQRWESQPERPEPAWVVNLEGGDLLGREVDIEALAVARSLATTSSDLSPVQKVTSLEGRDFVVYYPEGTGPSDRLAVRWLLEYPWLLALLFAAAGIALAGGLTIAWTRPIAELKAAFGHLADGQTPVEVDSRITRRGDEIGDLGRHFEDMSRRLARANEAQRQLLHDVSHEIRSPLARLSVAADLARRRPDRIEEAVERIDRDCQRLDRLVGELLTLARLEGGAAASLDDYFDLIELLRVIRDGVAFEADAVGIEVLLELPDQEEMVLRGNAELLHRAVENVVRNALQHAGESKRIEIVLDGGEEQGAVLLRIRDQGEGIDEEQLAALFEPFIRGHSSGGYGLGLAIARRAVALHGGTISATNVPEGGVEMQIRLPVEGVAIEEEIGLASS
ncbi:MAG: HAMP domain-containing sensor histidine kinase [Acidobacteriota bacterium]